MSQGITHFNKVSGINGVYAGANDSEVVIADSSGNLYIGGNVITATAAEINELAVSAETETITVAGAVAVDKKITNLDATSGAYAVTLAAPAAGSIGQTKVIQMTVAGNAITMALTNVQGGTAGTSASFDAVDETLVLVAGTNKWTVTAEVGVTLS